MSVALHGKQAQESSVLIDTTVQEKNITYPTDAKLARNVHWMVLYQICVFGADLKSNMTARVHNVFSLAMHDLAWRKCSSFSLYPQMKS
jgi:hypothetical protein